MTVIVATQGVCCWYLPIGVACCLLFVDTFPLELRALPHPNFCVAPHTSWVNGPGEEIYNFLQFQSKQALNRSYLHSYGGLVVACDRGSQGGCGTSRLQHTSNDQVHRGGNEVRANLVWTFTCRRRLEPSWRGRRVVGWAEARATNFHQTAMRRFWQQ